MTCEMAMEIIRKGPPTTLTNAEVTGAANHIIACPSCRAWLKSHTKQRCTPEEIAEIALKVAECAMDPECERPAKA